KKLSPLALAAMLCRALASSAWSRACSITRVAQVCCAICAGVWFAKLAFALGSGGMTGLPFSSRSTTRQAVSNRALQHNNPVPHCFNDIVPPGSLIKAEGFELRCIAFVNQHAIHQLFFLLFRFTVFQEVISLNDGHLRLFPARLQ